jgi:hypothetical protein
VDHQVGDAAANRRAAERQRKQCEFELS